MQLRDLAASKRDMLMIDPRIIQIDLGYNLRDLTTPDALEKLDQLARDIAHNGFSIEQPITVRLKDDKPFVVAGHRRRAAALIAIEKYGAEIQAIPCIGEAKGTSEADRTADIFVSNNGEPLAPLDKVAGIKRLMGFGWDLDKIAKKCGLGSAQNVENYLVLGSAPMAVQEMVKGGEVAASTAVAVTKKHGEGGAEILAAAKVQAATEGKTRVTNAHVRATTGEFQATSGNIKVLIGALQRIAIGNDREAAGIAVAALETVGVSHRSPHPAANPSMEAAE